MAAQSEQWNQAFSVAASDWPPITSAWFSVKIKLAAPMEVSLPQTMLQKLLDLLKLESFRPHQEIAIQSIIQDQKDAVICVPTSNMKALCWLVYFTWPPRCCHLWRVTRSIGNRLREEYRGTSPLSSRE